MFSYLEADVVPIILKVFRDNLCLQENERVIIATDYARPKDMMIKPDVILERIIKRNFLARRIQEIVKENKKIDDCVSLNPKVEISIDENPLPMNPFISRIVENVVRALLSSFKGYKKGSVKISIS